MDSTSVTLVAAGVVLAAPFLQTLRFPWFILDNYVVRAVLLGAILWAITQGAMPGIFVALAVVTLYFEKNRHRLADLATYPGNTPSTYLVKGSPTLPLAPSLQSVDYLPQTDDAGASVEAVESGDKDALAPEYENAPEPSGLDHKVVLEEAPLGDEAVSFFQRIGAA